MFFTLGITGSDFSAILLMNPREAVAKLKSCNRHVFAMSDNFLGNVCDLKMGSKKDSHQSAAFLGEGIFTMGYSKKYIMYWGVLQVL